jgi:hypothetical protein
MDSPSAKRWNEEVEEVKEVEEAEDSEVRAAVGFAFRREARRAACTLCATCEKWERSVQ